MRSITFDDTTGPCRERYQQPGLRTVTRPQFRQLAREQLFQVCTFNKFQRVSRSSNRSRACEATVLETPL